MDLRPERQASERQAVQVMPHHQQLRHVERRCAHEQQGGWQQSLPAPQPVAQQQVQGPCSAGQREQMVQVVGPRVEAKERGIDLVEEDAPGRNLVGGDRARHLRFQED
ncbi:hypothetical protein D3C72_2200390 [compost metagenome]